MEKAYRLLSYRDRSVKEIVSALEKKEFEPKIVAEVIARLKEQNYLDDRKFAMVYGSSMLRRRKVGPRYLLNKLVNKGVDKHLAQETVESIFHEHGGTGEEIDYWIERKLGSIKKSVEPLKKKKKIYDFLLRKGFTAEEIFMAFDGWEF